MLRSFFAEMRLIDKQINKGDIEYTQLCKDTFIKLVGLMEAPYFLDSTVQAYITKNWRLNCAELTRKWNNESIKEKSSNTMRSQVSTLSRQLYQIFGETYYASFITDNRYELENIRSIISFIEISNISFDDLFIKGVTERCNPYSANEYSIEDCIPELAFLSKFQRVAINEEADRLSEDKLAYLRKVINQPLVNSIKGEINAPKIQAVKYLFAHGGMNDNKYGFADIPSIIDIIDERVSEADSSEEISATEYEKARRMLSVFTEQGIKETLTKYKPKVIRTVLHEMEQKHLFG